MAEMDMESRMDQDNNSTQGPPPLSPEVVEVKLEVEDDEIQLIENEPNLDQPGQDFMRPTDSDSNSRPDGSHGYRDSDPLALPPSAQLAGGKGVNSASTNPQYFFLLLSEYS